MLNGSYTGRIQKEQADLFGCWGLRVEGSVKVMFDWPYSAMTGAPHRACALKPWKHIHYSLGLS